MGARAFTAVAVAFLGARALAACTDGVTPDCSNPAVCSPIEGDAGPLAEPDASEAGSTPDAGSDVRTTTPADASDSG